MKPIGYWWLAGLVAAALLGCNSYHSAPNPPKPTAEKAEPPAVEKGERRMVRAATFLMFEGNAEKAMKFYVSLFPGSAVGPVERYGPNEAGAESSVKRADFTIAGHNLMCSDSPIKHDFTFTPSISLFINCADEAEQAEAFKQLSAGGQVLMPLDNYGFSKKFAWVKDRFGVSWQLNLP